MNEQVNILSEEIKKSKITAKDFYDYRKLEMTQPGLLPCSVRENGEDIIFEYDIAGYKTFELLSKEEIEHKYQFLINFKQLIECLNKYKCDVMEENIYYDENYLPSCKSRDVYGENQEFSPDTFLYLYKCFAAGVLQKKYSVKNLRESGIEVLNKDKEMREIIEAEYIDQLVEVLKEKRKKYIENIKAKEVSVDRKKYTQRKIISRCSIILLLIGLMYTGYQTIIVGPAQRKVISANQTYINQDYVGCISTLKDVSLENMDVNTKYILAVSYTKGETLKKEEMQTILAKLTTSSDERELNYWIQLGRLQLSDAQDSAIALSDDRLLIYAYMKEVSVLENDTSISGAQKQSRLQELEANITSLGEKYTNEEVEANE